MFSNRVYTHKKDRVTHQYTALQSYVYISMRAIKAALQYCKAEMSTEARMNKTMNKEGVPGTRAGPPKVSKTDKKIGIRLDYGGTYTTSDGRKYQNINLQINKDAENPTLAKLERSNQHMDWAQSSVEIRPKTKAETRQAYDDLFNALEDDLGLVGGQV